MRLEKLTALLDLARTLAATAEGLTLDEMATRAGVTRRTAERMRDALRSLFPTLEALSEGREKRFRIPNGMDAFFRAPTTDELAELDMAARSLEAQGGGERARLLRSLSAKVRATLRAPQRRRIEPDLDALVSGESLIMHAGPKPLAEPRTLETLREALKGARYCLFDYAGADGPGYRREVAPYGILFGRAYYLVGPERNKPRPVMWRFDRISRVALGETFGGPPSSFGLREYAARSFGAFQEEPERIVLRFLPSAAADARRFEFHPNQALEEQPGGALFVRFEAGGMRELAHHLMTWGPTVTVVSPDRLRQVMREEVEALHAHYCQTRRRPRAAKAAAKSSAPPFRPKRDRL